MDRMRNPFTPGAGALPPELAGRESIIEDGQVLAGRMLRGRYEQGMMLIGLRGVGKTVLLKHLAEQARREGVIPVVVEVRNSANDMEELTLRIKEALCSIDLRTKMKASVNFAYSVLRNFVKSISVNIGEFGMSVETNPGLGESGNMEFDLSEVLMASARAAKDSGTAVGLYIDELQNLNVEAMRGIIVAIHHANQEQLPLYLVGSGLPSIRGLIGKSKTYAERMFNYEVVGALDLAASTSAIANPLKTEGVEIETSAMSRLHEVTDGYPYFLQESGYQLWLHATKNVIVKEDVDAVMPAVIARLDKNFFDVRFDRVSTLEREILRTMADVGGDEIPISALVEKMGRTQASLSTARASLIRKGMIYASSFGHIAYTVPMFSEYLKRKMSNSKSF